MGRHCRVVSNARAAAAIAASMSAAEAFATTATTEPSYGLRTSSRSEVSFHSPANGIGATRSGAMVSMSRTSAEPTLRFVHRFRWRGWPSPGGGSGGRATYSP